MHRAMIRENVRLAATHPDASAPWTWPLMKVAPYFWQGEGASIYLVGNPVVWWGSSLALAGDSCCSSSPRRPLGRRLPAVVNPRAKPWLALDRLRDRVRTAAAGRTRAVSLSLPDAAHVCGRVRAAVAGSRRMDARRAHRAISDVSSYFASCLASGGGGLRSLVSPLTLRLLGRRLRRVARRASVM